jgi:hypothetical protein
VIDDVIIGTVTQSGEQAGTPGRQAALAPGCRIDRGVAVLLSIGQAPRSTAVPPAPDARLHEHRADRHDPRARPG